MLGLAQLLTDHKELRAEAHRKEDAGVALAPCWREGNANAGLHLANVHWLSSASQNNLDFKM